MERLESHQDDQLAAFTFFRSYYEAARELNGKERLALYDAITQYCFDGIEPEVSGTAKAMFLLCKPNLSKSIARANAGASGGKAKVKQTSSKAETNDEQTPSYKDKDKDKDIGLRIQDEDTGLGIEDKDNTPQPPQAGERGAASVEKSPKADLSVEFEQFWIDYPKKVGKGEALKAWKKLKPNAELRKKILVAIQKQKNSEQWLKDGGQFIPNPATWLNGGRWDDEPKPAKGGAANGTDGNEGHYGGQSGTPSGSADYTGFRPSTGFTPPTDD